MSDASPPKGEETIFSVDTLLKYMGNDDKALAIVSKIVRDACAPGLAPIQQAGAALREERLPEAGKLLHSLRGSIGTLGAKRLVASSLKVEQAVAERQLDQIPPVRRARGRVRAGFAIGQRMAAAQRPARRKNDPGLNPGRCAYSWLMPPSTISSVPTINAASGLDR